MSARRDGLAETIHSCICEESLIDHLEYRGRCLRAAESILEDFAVVQLPTQNADLTWTAAGGREVTYDSHDNQVWYGLLALDPQDARSVAAAMIAAANHANEATP